MTCMRDVMLPAGEGLHNIREILCFRFLLFISTFVLIRTGNPYW